MVRTNFQEIRMHIHRELAHKVRVKDVSILCHRCQNLITFTMKTVIFSPPAILRWRYHHVP